MERRRILLSKITSSNKASVTIACDSALETGTEFLQTIRNNKSIIEITNLDESIGRYRRSVIIDGSKLPENITGPVKINGLIKTTDIPEALLNKYKSVYENVNIKAYVVDSSFQKLPVRIRRNPHYSLKYPVKITDIVKAAFRCYIRNQLFCGLKKLRSMNNPYIIKIFKR